MRNVFEMVETSGKTVLHRTLAQVLLVLDCHRMRDAFRHDRELSRGVDQTFLSVKEYRCYCKPVLRMGGDSGDE